MTLARDIKVGDRIYGRPGFKVRRIIRDGSWIDLVGRSSNRMRLCREFEDLRIRGPEPRIRHLRIRGRHLRRGDEVIGYGRIVDFSTNSREEVGLLFDTGNSDWWPIDFWFTIRRGNASRP